MLMKWPWGHLQPWPSPRGSPSSRQHPRLPLWGYREGPQPVSAQEQRGDEEPVTPSSAQPQGAGTSLLPPQHRPSCLVQPSLPGPSSSARAGSSLPPSRVAVPPAPSWAGPPILCSSLEERPKNFPETLVGESECLGLISSQRNGKVLVFHSHPSSFSSSRALGTMTVSPSLPCHSSTPRSREACWWPDKNRILFY